MLIYSGASGKMPRTAVFSEMKMREDIDRVEYASMLYDFYGSLLSEAKREVMSMYHEDNLSLSEIAEELGQTRQAVHYTLKKAEKALEEYEDKLGLIAAYEKNQERAALAYGIIGDAGLGKKEADKLKALIKEITE
jgi:predicted DNA-binding protein YlxM (UPF0122 family)